MTRDHIEAWRDYLAEQMHERFGVANDEAQKIVERWLRSTGRQIHAVTPIRNQRHSSSIRRGANRIRSARA